MPAVHDDRHVVSRLDHTDARTRVLVSHAVAAAFLLRDLSVANKHRTEAEGVLYAVLQNGVRRGVAFIDAQRHIGAERERRLIVAVRVQPAVADEPPLSIHFAVDQIVTRDREHGARSARKPPRLQSVFPVVNRTSEARSERIHSAHPNVRDVPDERNAFIRVPVDQDGQRVRAVFPSSVFFIDKDDLLRIARLPKIGCPRILRFGFGLRRRLRRGCGRRRRRCLRLCRLRGKVGQQQRRGKQSSCGKRDRASQQRPGRSVLLRPCPPLAEIERGSSRDAERQTADRRIQSGMLRFVRRLRGSGRIGRGHCIGQRRRLRCGDRRRRYGRCRQPGV